MSHNSNSQGSSPSGLKESVLFIDFFSAVKHMRDTQVRYAKRKSLHNAIEKMDSEIQVDRIIYDVLSTVPNPLLLKLTKKRDE